MKVQLSIVPLKYYYNNYFSDTNDKIIDLGLYSKDLSIIKMTINAMPLKVTCLMESLVVREILKEHGVSIKISLGVKVGKELLAHAWYQNANGYIPLNK